MSAADDYLNARAEFERVSAALKALGSMISTVGKMLCDSPSSFIFADIQPELPNGASTGTVSVNAIDWKSAHQIQTALADWHDKRDAVYSTWEKVPADIRSGLVHPKPR